VIVDQFGSPTFTKDLSEALEKLISLALKNESLGGVYHFSNRGSCSWYKYAEEIVKIAYRTGATLLPITSAELDRPAPRPRMSILNTEKYSNLCGDKPRDWKLALKDHLINEQGTQRDYVQRFKT
jgi:dTDP-4-dehydrorhamnose reductase